jgi:predicted pyridoxine 5'-phosphate oxidase superfamily flavin-nucleotide-binding protein
MPNTISSIAQLEACIGAAGLPVKMKIIDHLDAAAAGWIAASPIAFVGLAGDDGPRVCAAGGPAGFASVQDAGTLSIPLAALDAPGQLKPGQGAGVLFLIPGLGETLRANGQVKALDETTVLIAIEECFVHCAKALIRSDFWTPAPAATPSDPAAFVNAARFLALATMDAGGRIDISPKGDPAGLLIAMQGERATLAERPGNRLAFGYRNMIEQPRVAALALIPGATEVASFSGQAHLTTDEAVRAAFMVDEKTPLLATMIEGAAPVLAASPALQRAGLWTAPHPAPAVDPAAALVAHLKLNKARGATATLLRLAANRGLVAKGLETNYKTDLY